MSKWLEVVDNSNRQKQIIRFQIKHIIKVIEYGDDEILVYDTEGGENVRATVFTVSDWANRKLMKTKEVLIHKN